MVASRGVLRWVVGGLRGWMRCPGLGPDGGCGVVYKKILYQKLEGLPVGGVMIGGCGCWGRGLKLDELMGFRVVVGSAYDYTTNKNN